jgi:hypothetical protein
MHPAVLVFHDSPTRMMAPYEGSASGEKRQAMQTALAGSLRKGAQVIEVAVALSQAAYSRWI